MAFQIHEETNDSVQVIHLSDPSSGVSARISPTLGWNLFELHLLVDDKPVPVLMGPTSFEALKAAPSRFGNPVLFPFPNRIQKGQFQWQGQTYNTPINNGGNAIHGYALRSVWRVKEKLAENDFAQVTAVWELSKDAPEHVEHWPANAKIEITYTLTRQELKVTAKVTNPDTKPLPWGLGYHTYFLLPLSDKSHLNDAEVIIPASRRWHLEQFLPTGTKEALPAALDFRNGLPLQGLKADDVLTDLAHIADGRVECLLKDKAIGWEIALSTPRAFSELVVFTPSWNANSIAIEPYTQTTDAINLAGKGIDGGLRVLEPGKSESMDLRIISRKSTGRTQ